MTRLGTAALVVCGVLLAGCEGAAPAADEPRVTTAPTEAASAQADTRPEDRPRQPPLRGKVVVLDPGHQLGNAAHPAEIAAPVDAGGFTKPCNTQGTSTDDGYPEATLNWQVAREARRLLERRGARVLLTRADNTESAWGPCVDARGRAGNRSEPGPTADVKVSIHADGSYAAGAHGFHVIAPQERDPWTTDIAGRSLRLARVVRNALEREGLATSTYVGTDGVDLRSDLGTLNLADVPTVLVELGNMRDPGDAALMTSARGRASYARAVAAAIERYLTR